MCRAFPSISIWARMFPLLVQSNLSPFFAGRMEQMAFELYVLSGLFFPLKMSFWDNGSLELSPALLLSPAKDMGQLLLCFNSRL